MSSRLGEILIKESLITSEQLRQALEHQKSSGGRLGTCLMKLGFISEDEITGVLSRQYGVPSINLKFYEVDAAVIKLIPQDTAVRYQIVPLMAFTPNKNWPAPQGNTRQAMPRRCSMIPIRAVSIHWTRSGHQQRERATSHNAACSEATLLCRKTAL